jgi:O-antigen/teichoic acid export membrane protein
LKNTEAPLPADLTSSTLELAATDSAAADHVSVEAIASAALQSKAIRATFWTVTDYASSMALRVVSSMVLTRLLMPESFGLMTLVTTLIVGISLVSDIGLGPSVIQNPRGDDPVLLNTAWTLQVLRGLGIFLVSLILAWPMSLIYDHRLIWLLPALGANAVITSFYSTNLLSLSRHLGVRRVFLLDFSTQVVSLFITAGLALIFRSVWALILGTILSTGYRLALSFNRRLIPGIRNSFCWDRESVRSLVHFGKWILLATAFFFFASQADRLILGRLISFSMLGVYGIAYSVSDIPRAVINAFAQKVGYPFIAKMAHLPVSEFRWIFLRYRFRVLLAGAAMLSLMVHGGGFLITKMFDHRYHGAAWMVPILALGLWHTLMYATTMPALFSLGKSKYGAIGNATYFAAAIASIPLAFHFFGMLGAVIAVAAADFPLYLVTVTGASIEGVSTWRQDLQATAVFVAFLGAGLAIRMSITGHGI